MVCDISHVGNERNGQPRYWCGKHYASATGPKGIRLSRCAAADRPELRDFEKLRLDPKQFRGGIAIWGALPPIFNTSPELEEYGVHVHARNEVESDSKKAIDGTYQHVEVCIGSDLLGPRWEVINTRMAVAYFATLAVGQEPKAIKCSHCQRYHLDDGIFGVRPHRKHRCEYCGRDFFDDDHGIGNPIVVVKRAFSDDQFEREVHRSPKELSLSLRDFDGGVAVWASNPAAFWTQPRSEHSGIHLHAYGKTAGGDARIVEDETFGSLNIEGIRLSRPMMRLLMAQRSIPEIRDAVKGFRCPECNAPHFDRDEKAVTPHDEHECELCGHLFRHSSGRASIGNPLIDNLETLARALVKEARQ